MENLIFSWDKFKSLFITSKDAKLFYISEADYYLVYAFEGGIVYSCKILKTSPASSDQTDFETNYLPSITNDKIYQYIQLVGESEGNFYLAKVSESGRQLIDTSPPAPPADTTSVVVTEYGNVSTNDDYDFLIPNGETLKIQRFSGGAEPGDGSVVELWHDPNGTKIGMIIIDTIFSNGHSDQHDLNEQYIGNGTRRIIMRRKALGSSSAREMFGRWEGYY